MAEYIDREATVGLLENKYQDMSAMPASYYAGFQYALNMLKQISSAADVQQVVHGEWINVYGDFSTAECVVCKSQFEVTFGEESNGALWDGFCQFYRYCPYCGARMDGEQK